MFKIKKNREINIVNIYLPSILDCTLANVFFIFAFYPEFKMFLKIYLFEKEKEGETKERKTVNWLTPPVIAKVRARPG